MGMHTISPVNPEIMITSKPDDWVTQDASGFDLNNKIIDEHHEGEWFSKDHQDIDVKSMLDDWVDFKEEASAGYLKRIIRRLRKDGRFSLALKVYEWMRNKGIYKFSCTDHAVLINLIWRVRGFSAAERHVRHLPKQARNDKTYGELLHCYVHENRTGEALLHFQKMKELGFALSLRPLNEIIRLYANSLQIEKVLGVLAEMKKSKVSPDNDSYRICISSFGLKYDVDGMERMLREMESQPHIVMDWCTYAVVAQFYDREFLVDKATDALEKARVILQKKEKRRKSPNYLLESEYENVIKSLVKLGELDEAMKFVKEWEVLGNWRSVIDIRVPYPIIEEYIKNGALGKAYSIIFEWAGKGKKGVDKLSRLLCREYLKADELFQAYNCFLGCDHNCGPQLIQMMFLQYLEEACGSFFPLYCGASLCSRSFRTDDGKTILELIPVDARYKLKVALLVHPEDSAAQAVNVDYENIIRSLVEWGELNEARKMAREWESSGNLSSLDDLNISKLIIEGYCRQGLFIEAEGLAEAWTREKKCWAGGIWFILADHYQEQGKLVRGFECMRRFWDFTPWLEGSFEFEMFLFMIDYSRGMSASLGHLGRDEKDTFFYLYDMLCPYQR
ncbi:unnamed protein product [Cuscuta campestris]|uniref:Pentacotripeptide-repeat region of PRORP domain-containing protein n=1 Tax=Cuscuta campestris TaxID=132261 RepID=A0A484M7S4_9ASTE|nr:unnamed protein product [Cuscuta campestris]